MIISRHVRALIWPSATAAGVPRWLATATFAEQIRSATGLRQWLPITAEHVWLPRTDGHVHVLRRVDCTRGHPYGAILMRACGRLTRQRAVHASAKRRCACVTVTAVF